MRWLGLAGTVMLLAGCDQQAVPAGYFTHMAGYQPCTLYGAFGERLSIRQCGGPDRPTYGQYHEPYPPRLTNGTPIYPAPYAPLPQPGVGRQ